MCMCITDPLKSKIKLFQGLWRLVDDEVSLHSPSTGRAMQAPLTCVFWWMAVITETMKTFLENVAHAKWSIFVFDNRIRRTWSVLSKIMTSMKVKVKVKSLSHVQLFATPWTVTYQAPWSMGFSRQEYWSELPFPFPGDLPNPGIEPGSPALQIDALPSEPLGKPNSNKFERCHWFKYVALIISLVFSNNLKVGSYTFSPNLSHWMIKDAPSLLF